MRTSLGQVGRGDQPYTSSDHPRWLQGPTPEGPAEMGVLTKGHVTRGAGSGDCVGLTPCTQVRILYLGTLYLLSVSCPPGDFQHQN